MPRGTLCQINIPEYAVIAEHILAFKITPCAPLINEDFEGVFTLSHIIGNIKFGAQVASLRKSRILTVDLNKRTGRNAFKPDINPAPFFINRKCSPVKTAGVFVRNKRTIDRIREVYIRIIGVFISLQLPAGRNGYFVPFFYRFEDFGLVFKEGEVPFAV